MILAFGLSMPDIHRCSGKPKRHNRLLNYSGIYRSAFNFGIVVLFLLLAYIVIVTIIGLKILRRLQGKREMGNKTYLGRSPADRSTHSIYSPSNTRVVCHQSLR